MLLGKTFILKVLPNYLKDAWDGYTETLAVWLSEMEVSRDELIDILTDKINALPEVPLIGWMYLPNTYGGGKILWLNGKFYEDGLIRSWKHKDAPRIYFTTTLGANKARDEVSV